MAFFSAPDSAPGQIKLHHRLRRVFNWLLPVGAGLLLWLANALAKQAAPPAQLTGYHYRQVGVQADSTYWVLAYRNGQAELLVRPSGADTTWQRRPLALDTVEAEALALDWGGKALVVGHTGTVRVYDSLLRPLPTLRRRLPFWDTIKGKRALVAVDDNGRRAVVASPAGQVYITNDGGRHWFMQHWPTNGTTLPLEAMCYSDDYCYLASRAGFNTIIMTGNDTVSTARILFSKLSTSEHYEWPKILPASIAWCGFSGWGNGSAILTAYDRAGNWVNASTASSGLNAAAKAFFGNTRAVALAVALIGRSNRFVGISDTQLIQVNLPTAFPFPDSTSRAVSGNMTIDSIAFAASAAKDRKVALARIKSARRIESALLDSVRFRNSLDARALYGDTSDGELITKQRAAEEQQSNLKQRGTGVGQGKPVK